MSSPTPTGLQSYRWTDADFESMTWHDCTIHSMGLDQDDVDQSDFLIDLDFLLEWIPMSDGTFQFRIAPALLRFYGVDKLAIHTLLDYKQAMQISGITRSTCNDPAFSHYHWVIDLHSYAGRDNCIEFDATAFSQELTAQPIVTNRQSLYLTERRKLRELFVGSEGGKRHV